MYSSSSKILSLVLGFAAAVFFSPRLIAQDTVEVPGSQTYPLGNGNPASGVPPGPNVPNGAYPPNPYPAPSPAPKPVGAPQPEVEAKDPSDFQGRDAVQVLAEAYAKQLVSLKMNEVELITGLGAAAEGEANDDLALVQAKIETVEAELRELTVAHLRRERMKLTEVFRPSHPKVVELDAQISERLQPTEIVVPEPAD